VIAPLSPDASIAVISMSYDPNRNGRPRLLGPFADIGMRTLRPLSGFVDAAVGAGLSLERRAVDRVLDSNELERIVTSAIESPHLQAALRRVFESAGARQIVDSLFDSGLLEHLIDRLLTSDAVFRLVDEIAASPTVTAAISQQGLGFADQVGDEMRRRSSNADDWLERTARRLLHREQRPTSPEPEQAG
jgi:hypothetical protein